MHNQVTSIEEFMQTMHDLFVEAMSVKASLEVSITYIQPVGSDPTNPHAVYECVFDEGVPFQFERILLAHDLQNVFGYFTTNMESKSPIDRNSFSSMMERISLSFDDDVDNNHMSSMMGVLSPAAQYMGTYRQFRVKLFEDGHIEYSLTDGIQVHADTAEMERDQAKALGIEKEITPSNPDRWIPLATYTVTGLQSL